MLAAEESPALDRCKLVHYVVVVWRAMKDVKKKERRRKSEYAVMDICAGISLASSQVIFRVDLLECYLQQITMAESVKWWAGDN